MQHPTKLLASALLLAFGLSSVSLAYAADASNGSSTSNAATANDASGSNASNASTGNEANGSNGSNASGADHSNTNNNGTTSGGATSSNNGSGNTTSGGTTSGGTTSGGTSGASSTPSKPAAPVYAPELVQAMYLGGLHQDNLMLDVDFTLTAPYLHQLNDSALWVQADGMHASWKTDDKDYKILNKGYRVLVGSNLLVRPQDTVTTYLGLFANFSQSTNKVNAVAGKAMRESKAKGFGGGVYLSLYTNTTEDSGGFFDLWAQYNQFKHTFTYNKKNQEFLSRGISLSMSVRHKSLIYVQGLDDGGTLNLGLEPIFQLTSYGSHLKPVADPESKNWITPFNVFNLKWTLGLNLTLNSRIAEHTVWDSFVGVSYVGTWKAEGLKFTLPESLYQPAFDANVSSVQGKRRIDGMGETLSSRAGLNALVFTTGFRVYAGQHFNANINGSYTLGDNGYRAYSFGLGARLSF